MKRARAWIAGAVVVPLLLWLGYAIVDRLSDSAPAEVAPGGGPSVVPVETVPIARGAIENRRVFSGSLDATARITIAPKVAGRILSLPVDLSDPVQRGSIVATLDDGEFTQAVAQATADLAVERAGLVEAESAATIAQRELERVRTLHERGIASDSQFDTVQANQLSKDAAVAVAKARVTSEEAALETARIRLEYATIRAAWEGGGDVRVVAERFVEDGDTVSANTPLLSVIELDPIEAIIYATERDYALLAPGQPVTLVTDAWPDRRWTGAVARVSPVFREDSRQARVEISVPNDDAALKPGMFVRVDAVLGRENDATIVPVEALTERDGRAVVFVVGAGQAVARMVPVRVGIADGERVQVFGDGLAGDVVTLGQQLLEDGTSVTVAPVNAG